MSDWCRAACVRCRRATHLASRGYIITAPLRPQWEQRRGNCALVVRSRERPNRSRRSIQVAQTVTPGHSDCAGSPPQRLRADPLALASLLRRHFGGLGQEAGIIRSENDPAKSDGGLHLGLAERPIGLTRMT